MTNPASRPPGQRTVAFLPFGEKKRNARQAQKKIGGQGIDQTRTTDEELHQQDGENEKDECGGTHIHG